MSMACTAYNINHVNELNGGGSVFPIPRNTLDVVNTIPAEMKPTRRSADIRCQRQSLARLAAAMSAAKILSLFVDLWWQPRL